ncbi:MAG: iron-sulfur cluster assembly accessory protein, partial [Deltaproteobacteria bacterium]|nr:iron-sulfur cluster assembly accessory protein [Deltaproteobacteria bacterium]
MEAENTDYQVVLTPEAAQVVRQTFEEQQVDEATSYLRIGARPGGCSGYKYTMDFSREEELGEG